MAADAAALRRECAPSAHFFIFSVMENGGGKPTRFLKSKKFVKIREVAKNILHLPLIYCIIFTKEAGAGKNRYGTPDKRNAVYKVWFLRFPGE